MAAILIIEQDGNWRTRLVEALASTHRLTFCKSPAKAVALLQKAAYEVIICDLTAAREAAVEFIQDLVQEVPQSRIMVTSPEEKAEFIVRLIRLGVFDFIDKPYSADRIRLAVSQAMENRSLKNEIDYLRRQQDVVYDFSKIIAKSRSMQQVMGTMKKLADTDSTVLVTGETGTGKSVLSGSMHFNSARRDKPFVKITCANIPETLLESELFGHEKGAFTGANKTRVGRLEQANGGTVFLDEIGELSPALQAKLLQVLEDKSFERVGGNRTIRSDIRIITATNRNLEQRVADRTFREDLYYRINVLRVHLPPLRERPDCIEPLAYHLLEKICRSVKKRVDGFAPGVITRFRSYSWPGNIRELSNVIERAVIIEDGLTIERDSVSLPEPVSGRQSESRTDSLELNNNERSLILQALEESLWIQRDAAARLGITPRILNYKIKKFGITHPRWRKNK